ncbi:MAG: leucyl aminopeptidase [Gammaproteobacteria bacterium]|nr:leucyl aminopeptidase [Gammaproteobacteria bacterium]
MKFTIKHGDLEKQAKAALIVGIFEKNQLTNTALRLDKASKGYITKLIKQGEILGKIGQSLLLRHLPGSVSEHILLVGCGKKQPMDPKDYRKIVANSIKAIQNTSATQAICFLGEMEVAGHDLSWNVKQTVEVSSDALYRFDEFKSEKAPKSPLKDITIAIADKKSVNACEKALAQGIAIAESVSFTKNIENQPSNICNPTYLADQAKKLAKAYKTITTKVLEEKEMQKLGMGALLAVTKGSAQAAKLICLEYKGTSKKQAPVALVGKGITFDTGGISLKPADGMVGMKYDMCGAASVLGTLRAIAELKLPIHVVGILAAAENMPGGNASKPEDIVTTLSGQTVEIMNTDAEGRLVLCDALTYSERYKPEVVIDIATLTGAVVIALGAHASGLLSNNDGLAKDLLDAGTESFDRAWQLPLWDEYQDQLKSPFADMSNVGGRSAGTITAACFLSRFAKKFKWAHLDVAGTAAMMGGNDRFATGRPVPMLTQYLINRSKK